MGSRMFSLLCVLFIGCLLETCSAGPVIKKGKQPGLSAKQTEFFLSDWGKCEPLKSPLTLPEVNNPATWARCQKHLPQHPKDIEEYLPRLSRCMLKSIGWVRSNGNMNLGKYLEYIERLGMEEQVMNGTRETHTACVSKAYKEKDYKTQDKVYVECMFKFFTKECGPNFQGAVKEGYIVGITQISFMPRYGPLEVVDDVDEGKLVDEVKPIDEAPTQDEPRQDEPVQDEPREDEPSQDKPVEDVHPLD
ncbi:uncharacterized protein LOC135399819 isoform X2 [Ornithodoros turicata]|uniref:uncharacterized protein LOC135399819 isoform X2 n=1 Tax=Ornithodoros turicata TaxID=34597 RepID=UPI0031392BCC